MTTRLYVADVHIEDAADPRLSALTGLLQRTHYDELYLLGDITEMWIGDDDDSELATAFAGLVASATQRSDVYFLAGNRDFLLGSAFAARTGLNLLTEPHLLSDGTLLCHGDTLCTDDDAYQQMRALLRSQQWQTETLARSLADRRELGAVLRARSRTDSANKAANIMDVNSAAVTELLDRYDAPRLIHGHTHRPGIHDVAGGRQRYVLGDWQRCGWWLVQHDGECELHCAGLEWLATG